MTTDRNVTRALDLWLAEGSVEVNDRVLDLVEERIRRKRQLPAWLLPRRDRYVNSTLKLAAGLAAVLVIAVVGWQLLGRQNGIGPGTPTSAPTTTPTAPATQSPSPTLGSGPLPDGRLAAGHYTISPAIEGFPGLTVATDIPAGWSGFPDVPALTSPSNSDAFGIGGLIGIMPGKGLFSNPCRWDVDGTGSTSQPGDVAVGPTVNDLVSAIQANTSYTASTPSPVTVGGFQGVALELQLPGDDVLLTCDGDRAQAGDHKFIVLTNGFWAQGPDSRWRLNILDVNGTRLVTMISSFGALPQAELDAAQAIVASFVITP